MPLLYIERIDKRTQLGIWQFDDTHRGRMSARSVQQDKDDVQQSSERNGCSICVA